MTSEIKVDTISEQTSANGVTIDGLTIKDGNIIGDVALAGTTPTFTIGDAGAEDAALIFDGNAQDFYVALDDSADDLVIGLGNTIGTTPIMSFDENKDVVIHDGGLTITTADNTDTLTLTSTDADATVGPNLRLYRNSSSPADSDDIGSIRFDMRNDNSQDFTVAQITGDIGDVSDGVEKGELIFNIMTAGTLLEHMRLSNGKVTFNEGSADIDFRVESNGNANMLFVDGGNDRVGIGTGTPADALHIKAGNGIVRIHEATQADTKYGEIESSNGRLFFHSDRGDAESGSDMRFTIDDSEKVRIHSNGNVSIPGGIELGSGLDATAANLLDDYEEGTFTPAFTVASGSVAVNGNHDTLSYTKIGNVVHTFGKVVAGSISSPSGAISINLPFAVADITDSAGSAWQPIFAFLNGSGITDGNYMVIAEVEEGTSLARLYYKPDHHLANNLSDAIASGSDIWLKLTYRTV